MLPSKPDSPIVARLRDVRRLQNSQYAGCMKVTMLITSISPIDLAVFQKEIAFGNADMPSLARIKFHKLEDVGARSDKRADASVVEFDGMCGACNLKPGGNVEVSFTIPAMVIEKMDTVTLNELIASESNIALYISLADALPEAESKGGSSKHPAIVQMHRDIGGMVKLIAPYREETIEKARDWVRATLKKEGKIKESMSELGLEEGMNVVERLKKYLKVCREEKSKKSQVNSRSTAAAKK